MERSARERSVRHTLLSLMPLAGQTFTRVYKTCNRPVDDAEEKCRNRDPRTTLARISRASFAKRDLPRVGAFPRLSSTCPFLANVRGTRREGYRCRSLAPDSSLEKSARLPLYRRASSPERVALQPEDPRVVRRCAAGCRLRGADNETRVCARSRRELPYHFVT